MFSCSATICINFQYELNKVLIFGEIPLDSSIPVCPFELFLRRSMFLALILLFEVPENKKERIFVILQTSKVAFIQTWFSSTQLIRYSVKNF